MHLGKGLNSALYGLPVSLDCVRLRQTNSRLNSRQHVLGTVLGFTSEYSDLRLVLDAVGNVTSEAACMDELIPLPQHVGIDKRVTGRAILATQDRVVIL